MKKAFRFIKWALLVVVALVVLLFSWFWFIYLKPPAEFASLSNSEPYSWYAISLKDSCMCSDGSAFKIYFKKGKTNNLLINFSGGGASWDDTTGTHPATYLNFFDDLSAKKLQGFYTPSLIRLMPQMLIGITENDNPANPFRDWNVVYIPYCTGDLHMGHSTRQYRTGNTSMEVHHNGRVNSAKALEWMYKNIASPAKIVVSGESAGAYGSAFWAPAVADHYTASKIYQLSDACLLRSARWKQIADTVWNSESSAYLHFNIQSDLYEDALLNRTDSANGRIVHLHANTTLDEILPMFSAQLNHLPVHNHQFIDQWSDDTRASMSRLSKAGIQYYYFLSDGFYDARKYTTPHTVTNRYYYSMKSDGLAVADWLRKCVIEDKPVSVGAQLLSAK
jgi:hypothetical protein